MPTVLDTNTLASMAVSHPDSKLSFIGKCWMQKVFQVYLSDHIITELERTLSKPYFNCRLPSDEAKGYINNIIKHSIKQEVTTVIDREKIKSNYWRDINAEDDQVLATAVDAKAKYLVTGDKELAKLWSFEGVLIIPPSDFVEILERYKSP
jgi:uncharacterized protein